MRVDKDVRLTQIGIDRIIRLSWLKKTAQYALAGSQVHESKVALQDEIKDSFQYDNQIVRGSLDKTITILTKTWFIVPNHLIPLRNDGLKLISNLPAVYHTPVHWGMLMAVYPFWGATATQVGRLLKIQPSVTASQVQRRLREQYGERETVSRSAQRAMRSYVDWKVLSETETKGVYTSGDIINVDEPHLVSWLIEAFLHSKSNGSANIHGLIKNPSLFPFRIKPTSAGLLMSVSPRLECMRHGLDEDLVMLRK
ncbi:MAG: hypothetical protein BWY28_02289 [bacterium ADurb.Bin236]|mgnify:CR=1 FL=1|nr:MAG: hypothetical protein BWY28_02289 [bacterium ADurb.Bin236]